MPGMLFALNYYLKFIFWIILIGDFISGSLAEKEGWE